MLQKALFPLIFVLVSILSFTAPVNAQLFGGGAEHVDAKMIPEVKTVQPGSTFWVAFELTMDEHWHVYWRNVGDTGLETAIEWQLPEGLHAGAINWPYPERIVEDPLVVYGYHHTQYLLVPLTVSSDLKPGQKLDLKASVSWLVCAETCVPGEIDLSATVEVAETTVENPKVGELFKTARQRLPKPAEGFTFESARKDKELLLWVKPPVQAQAGIEFEFFPYDVDFVKYSVEQRVEVVDDGYLLHIPLSDEATVPASLQGILYNASGWLGNTDNKALEIVVPVSEKISSAAAFGFAQMLLAVLFAFLGGIILNLMPCVLPVLSIKIMGFIKQAHDEHVAPWKHGVMFTVGVLVSFWALAAILLILKAGGASLGWGFQLQSPAFLVVLSAFMFLFGLSMLGVFEIGTSMTTVGGKTQGMSGMMGSFVSGITATIVATPCTAPFMGSALGFALTQPAWVSLVIFTFIGLGMAFPFVLLSSIPALMKFVPKPGRWMESLEQFMGFLLVGTVIWLLWVLGIQVGANALVLVLGGLFITAIGGWVYGRWGNLIMPKRTRVIAWILAAVFIFGANGYVLANIDRFAVSQQAATHSGEGIEWQEFSEEKLAGLVAEGKPVFIDFTAAWCLSCQVNEQVAFSNSDVQDAFREKGITTLKADWTKRDETIARALAKYNRNSVPLYVLYDGKSKQPQLLPELITPGIVLDALKSVE